MHSVAKSCAHHSPLNREPFLRLKLLIVNKCVQTAKVKAKGLTIQSRVVRLNKRLLDLTILNKESVPFTSRTAKDGSSTIKVKIKGLGELELWIGDEADLIPSVICCGILSLEDGTYTALA
jgi:hypothetical protein